MAVDSMLCAEREWALASGRAGGRVRRRAGGSGQKTGERVLSPRRAGSLFHRGLSPAEGVLGRLRRRLERVRVGAVRGGRASRGPAAAWRLHGCRSAGASPVCYR